MSLRLHPRRSINAWVQVSPPGEGAVHTDRVGLETHGLAQLGPQEVSMIVSRLLRFREMLVRRRKATAP